MATLKLSSESEAIALMNKLVETGHVQHVSNPAKTFKNSPTSMYRIIDLGARGDGKAKQFPEPLLPRGGIKNISFSDVDPLEIARQLYVTEKTRSRCDDVGLRMEIDIFIFFIICVH